MPHVVIQYTANLEPESDIGALCATLAEIIVAQRDGAGGRVFPIGGTRVLAYPTPRFAVRDKNSAFHASMSPQAARTCDSNPNALESSASARSGSSARSRCPPGAPICR